MQQMPGAGAPPPFVWVFEAEPDKWVPFAPPDSHLIETEYLKSIPSVQTKLGGIDYFLDFQKMTRRNVISGSERKLRRIPFDQLQAVAGPPPQGPPGQAGQPPPLPQGPEWLFQDAEGKYMQVAPEDGEAVEQAYKSGNPVVPLTIRGVQYEMNFQTWKRKNLGSGSERAIRRVDPRVLPPFLPAEPGVSWFLKHEAGLWVPYTPDDGQAIEKAFAANRTGVAQVPLMGGQATYEMDFGKMITRNTQSGSERPMARIVDGKVDPPIG
eukprot:TRINITY_DN79348_c0_g1_i1.p1 TRINITY_DN79348_c0_g1~~TRINITY_DN79348_c0_g1_i1.p1  ORF type:complete len:267 (+),score=48.64 TRINITY_DN79348_c0_g1_i1:44-844(+)